MADTTECPSECMTYEEETSTLMSELDLMMVDSGPTRLPWGSYKERVSFPEHVQINACNKPGEFVLQTLFGEFTVLAEKKIEQVLHDHESQEKMKPLSQVLQRGLDPNFDQLLSALSSVAEHCLPSLLRTLFEWYDRQTPNEENSQEQRNKYRNRGEKDLCEIRDHAVDFIYCLVLIEVLKQTHYHPGYEDLINHIIMQAFKHFKAREGLQSGSSATSANVIADLYAEVLGVLAQARFPSVKKRFLTELKELRSKDQNPYTTSSIISLLMGMKFFKVKMHPIEEFEASIQFLQECGHYFLEVKDKDIKHALAGLFVEILLPVAACVKMEVNVPVLKNFVEMLYSNTLDMSTKKKHCLALFPMVTCLLCVSQKQFFLNNWPYFLTMCLSHLKNKDPKMARVALESLYRLLWVYMIRIKCESNTATLSRLQSIVNSLFPKGSKVVVPRDTPLNIFVKIIQFIAQERCDFAMREIIFDLLCVGKPTTKVLTPERMSIGLRAFLVIADSLEQKEGEPPMPQTMGVLPSGCTLRVKKTFLNRPLSMDAAKTIGMSIYYPHVRKAFDAILRLLDSQVGKPLILTKTENLNKEPDEIITGERKPKIDLFRTCVAAIPRLTPDGMTRHDLLELLVRLTVHMDDELAKLSFQSLQNIMMDLPSWREDVVRAFSQLIQKEITDQFPQLLDQSLRRLIQLISHWKSITVSCQQVKQPEKTDIYVEEEVVEPKVSTEPGPHTAVLHELEGLALVMLCSCKPIIRKLAVVVLKEIRNLFTVLGASKDDPCVLDVIDKACPLVIEKVLPHLPMPEKAAVLSAMPLDFQWLADRTSIIWTSGYHENFSDNNTLGIPGMTSFDPWMTCLSTFLHQQFVMGHCPLAINNAWPLLYTRLNALFTHVDPNTTLNDNRTTSILRGSKKVTNERDMYMNLWQNYVLMGCCIAPPSQVLVARSASPDFNNSSPDSVGSDRTEVKPVGASVVTARDLYKLLVPLIRCDTDDMRRSIVNGLGHVNPEAFRDLVEELLPYIKEAIDRKQENVRRRRRRDILRLTLAKIFQYMAINGIFAQSPAGVVDPDNNGLNSTFSEYIEGARFFLENEGDKDLPILQDIRMHFSGFIRQLIRNTPVEKRRKLLSRELRYKLFYLFAGWSGKFGKPFGYTDRRLNRMNKDDRCTDLELSALQAMSAVLCCGPVFDPAGLNDDGYIYAWLDTLLGAHDEKIKSQIYKLAQETVVLLLEFNADHQALLDWVIDRCYTGSHEVADGCFNALALVFNNREYPCDHVAMLNVTLLNTGCPRIAIHETAVQLLHLLYKRFFLDDVCMTEQDSILRHDPERRERQALIDMLLSGPYSRSQLYLSETLAKLHPELTMPMFSEITHRFQTAIPAIRQLLLQYLLPWLHNMELLDPNLPPSDPLSSFPSKRQDLSCEYSKPPLKGEGWGSPQATEMVLNNLFYITAKFGDDHAKEIEDLWAALVVCWPGNLKVIIRYIVIITGMAPVGLLPYAKRVVVYLGRAKPEKLSDEMMNELQTVEALTFSVKRTQTPPFYRLTVISKRSQASVPEDQQEASQTHQLHLDKGQIHTKRHSGEDPAKAAENTSRTNSTVSLRSETSTSSSGPRATGFDLDEEMILPMKPAPVPAGEVTRRSDSPLPYPLPMPAYGGFFAPLSEMLPEGNLPNPPYLRCNLAVMLLTDLIMDGSDIDTWRAHLPLMLHIIFLGLDHSRPLIHEHCKKLLLNMLLVLSTHNDHFAVAKILLSNKAINEEYALTLPSHNNKDHSYNFVAESIESSCSSAVNQSTFSVNSTSTITPDSVSSLVEVDTLSTTEEVLQALIEFIVTRKCRPLWSYEDITSKIWNIRSAEQLEHFLKYVLRIFRESVPLAQIEQRWSQIALQLALSCSSRHYAGRSFQIFRALHVPLTSQMLSDILSRLVETVAEHGEDMQGYVTEIMLTLESSVDYLDVDIRSIDFVREVKELFNSTPNLNKEPRLEMKKSATIALRHSPPHHVRSTSYSLSLICRRAITSSPPVIEGKGELRHPRTLSVGEDIRKSTNLSRSRSAQSLKQLTEPLGQDDKLTILTQMFWLAVSMLESDYEYEYLLATRLLTKVLRHLQPDRPECRDKLDKMLIQLNWLQFPGVQALLLKGCTSPVTAEAVWSLLSKMTMCIGAPVIDPSACTGFPMNVVALLPYLVEHYEEPNEVCREAADHISQMCLEQSPQLNNLATVMTLYSRGTFAKDSFQWTKCVIKYLYDVYSHLSTSMIAFLVEVMEKGPGSTQGAVLQILHCMVHYIDITASPPHSINTDLLKIVAKYVENPQWKDALKILKLAVTRSSTLAAPPPSMNTSGMGDSCLLSHTSFAEAEISFKKELPGRTMEFTFDLSQTPIIGRKFVEVPIAIEPETNEKDKSEPTTEQGDDGSAMPSGVHITESLVSSWKKPQLSQTRTRERLVNLLTSYGQRVLPKSPSDTVLSMSKVIFSQSSDTIERQASMCSSSEEVSLAEGLPGEVKYDDDSSTEQHLGVFKDFDFLDTELDEELEGESLDKFNWGVRPHTLHEVTETSMRESSRSTPASNKEESECSDDEVGVMSPLDLQQALAATETIAMPNTILIEPGRTRRHSSPISSTQSVHSTGSDADMTDLSPSNASPNFCNLSSFMELHDIPCTDEVDDLWRAHVNNLMTDNTGHMAINTFHLFARLFQETQRKLNVLTKDVCGYLTSTDSLHGIAAQLSSMLELFTREADCPLVYTDLQMLTSCGLVEKHKFCILEINETYETYLIRREQTLECLDCLKSCMKLQALGETGPEVNGDEQRSDLCRCAYKLQFQLLLLFEGYYKLLSQMMMAAKQPHIRNLSKEVSGLKVELQRAMLEGEPEQDADTSLLQPDSNNTMTKSDAEAMLIECINSQQYSKALQHIKLLRSAFPGDMFGVQPTDDIESLLWLYCQYQSQLKPGVLVITQTEHDLSEVCGRLMDSNMQLSTSLAQLEQHGNKSPEQQDTTIIKPAHNSSSL